MRILCAENSPVTMAGISILLEVEGYRDVCVATCYREIKERMSAQSFDLLIAELRFSDVELLDVVEEIRQICPQTKILIYTYQDNPTYLARASAYRVFDFVLKKMSTSHLLRSISDAASDSGPSGSLIEQSNAFLNNVNQPNNPNTDHLTKREHQILTHLSLGLSNREISAVLGISLETVKEHVQNVLRKLNASDRTEAAVWALRKGVPTLNLQMPTVSPKP